MSRAVYRPAPTFDAAEVALLARPWNVRVERVTDLGSQEDRTFRLDCGRERYVLKVAHASDGTGHAACMNAAMEHAAGRSLPFAIPRPVPSSDGRLVVATRQNGSALSVRMLTFLDGQPLRE